jgi:hypothetical protein
MRFRFTGSGGVIDVTASYTPTDSFYEFVTAVQAVFERGGAHDVRLDEEPRISILTVEKAGERLVLSLKEETGAQRGRVEASFEGGCREVARNLYHLMRDVGYDRFVSDWRHTPPRSRIDDLWARVSGRSTKRSRP